MALFDLEKLGFITYFHFSLEPLKLHSWNCILIYHYEYHLHDKNHNSTFNFDGVIPLFWLKKWVLLLIEICVFWQAKTYWFKETSYGHYHWIMCLLTDTDILVLRDFLWTLSLNYVSSDRQRPTGFMGLLMDTIELCVFWQTKTYWFYGTSYGHYHWIMCLLTSRDHHPSAGALVFY